MARVVAADTLQLLLDGAHVLPHGAAGQRAARVRRGAVPYRRVEHDVDIVAEVALQDLIGRQALLRQVHAAPLGQTRALSADTITELGVQRLHVTLPHNVVVEAVVHQPVDVLKGAAPRDVGLIVAGGAGDVEIVAAAAVILGVDAVQRHGDLGQNIGPQSVLRPRRIDLAAGHVLDVGGKRHRHVLRRLIRRAQMDGDILRHHRKRHGSSLLSGQFQ